MQILQGGGGGNLPKINLPAHGHPHPPTSLGYVFQSFALAHIPRKQELPWETLKPFCTHFCPPGWATTNSKQSSVTFFPIQKEKGFNKGNLFVGLLHLTVFPMKMFVTSNFSLYFIIGMKGFLCEGNFKCKHRKHLKEAKGML